MFIKSLLPRDRADGAYDDEYDGDDVRQGCYPVTRQMVGSCEPRGTSCSPIGWKLTEKYEMCGRYV